MTCICEIIIYDISQIRTVYEALKSIHISARLSTPYASIANTGVDYYLLAHQALKNECPEIDNILFIDCGPYSGYAMAALRAGAKYIYVDLSKGDVLNSLKSMAQKVNAMILTHKDRPSHQFDMLICQNQESFKQWLLNLKNSTQTSPA